MIEHIERAERRLNRRLTAGERMAVTVLAIKSMSADDVQEATGVSQATSYDLLRVLDAAEVAEPNPMDGTRRHVMQPQYCRCGRDE